MTEDTIKVCVDRVLPPDLLVEAADRAVRENPANAAVFSFSPGVGVSPLPPPFIALLTPKKWKNGRTLRVRFLDGLPEVHAKVEEYAHQWSQHVNIKFEFGSDPEAEIRISFKHPGSWSYLGTDALTIPAVQPTMNYGWLTPDTADEEYSRVVLHEFGHALGCIHEHQNPAADIPWDKEAVYNYFMGPPNNWTKEDVDFNLFHKYSQNITQFTDFDPKSIMLYPIPNRFTIGDFEVPWRNRELSAMDKEFTGVIYPIEEKPITELTVDAPATEASIGKHGEEDLFTFDVPAEGRYRLETRGWTDIVMTLLGPENQTDVIAEDDDSGRWLNARIVATLEPGTYYVRIRHFRPRGTGNYRISVRAEE